MGSLFAVIYRELREIVRRPLYIISSLGVMVFVVVFFTTFLDDGLPQQQPVGVIDHDHSTFSRTVIQEVACSQSVRLVGEYANFTEAREAMQRGEIYVFFEMPEGLYDDLAAQRQPSITIYSAHGLMVGSMLAYKQLRTVLTVVCGGAQRQALRARGLTDSQIMTLIQPVVLDQHPLGNPWTSYAVYLLTTILPGILGMMITLLSVFTITREIKRHTSHRWVETANGSVTTAIIGKLLPYTFYFTILGIALNLFMFKIMRWPMNGQFWFQNLALMCYLYAMQATAVTIVGFVPQSKVAISITSLFTVLSISLSGFTYPVDSMYPAFQALSNLAPLRHYYLITVNQTLLGLPIKESLAEICKLMIFWIVPVFFNPRLKKAFVDYAFPD